MKTKIFYTVLLTLLFLQGSFALRNKGIDRISLNGTWEIIFDDKNEGVDGKWQFDENFSNHDDIREIKVPSCWEEFEQDYEGVVFYRKKFLIPAAWKDKIINIIVNQDKIPGPA